MRHGAAQRKNGVRLIRPFLQVHPERLKEFLREHGVSWAEDPSNRCDDYLRVRVRKFLPQLAAALDITPERIADTMSVLARSRDCLEEQAAQFVDRHVRWYEKAGFRFPGCNWPGCMRKSVSGCFAFC